MNGQLAMNIIFDLFSAAIFIYVGLRLGERNISEQADRLAWAGLRALWIALGAGILLASLSTFLALIGLAALPLHISLSLLNLLSTCIALWGLLFYLVYVYSGKQRWAWPLAGFYLAFFIALVAVSLSREALSLEIGSNGASVNYAGEINAAFGLTIILVVLLPQLIASLVYFSLVFRVKERSQKYRVVLVSTTILAWFGSALVAAFAGLTGAEWWPFASRLISLLVAVLIYWAYFPPRFVQRRLEIQGI
jgi:hypothetical protein